MKQIYSLGGGCYPYNDIPKQYRADTIFKSSSARNKQVFLPLEMFNGNLENEFLNKDGNWDIIKVNCCWDYDEIIKKRKKDEKYVSNYLVTYMLLNKTIGFCIEHGSSWKTNPTNKHTFRPIFEMFNQNKYNMLYLIDFQRGGYQNYCNAQLIEFEKFLVDNGYDLKNFIYIDVDSAQDKSRFDSCKIPVFIQDSKDAAGLLESNDKMWRNPKCFFARHMDYVEERLNA